MMASFYTGATGLRAYGEGMSSMANNLANSNTIGFKSAMMLYQDLTSQSVPGSSYYDTAASMPSQVGKGVSVEINRTMFFQQGSFESGSEPTDMGITGKGYFGVAKDGVTEYTRAGNFRFTKEGALIDPNGYTLLGNKITNGVTSAASEPIQMDLSASGQTYMAPKATTAVSLVDNLGSTDDATSNTDNPYFSLATAWDGASSSPLLASQYSHLDTVPVYDAQGGLHDLNIYYDYVDTYDGKKVYEFAVGSPSVNDSATAGVMGSGLFAAGTLTFTSSGDLMDMTMFQAPAEGNTNDLSNWLPASFDVDGNPVFSAIFTDTEGMALPAQNISLDLGLQMNGAWSTNYTSAADVAENPSSVYAPQSRERKSSVSTAYDGSSATVYQKQDGYADGALTTLSVGTDGVMSGRYSNGQAMDLYQIPLFRFISDDGLHLEGGNHFSATPASGPAEAGFAQTENFGTISEQKLEQSTVDMAKEFTTMILTQRGFQMNSKVVTTSDQMLQKALELKR